MLQLLEVSTEIKMGSWWKLKPQYATAPHADLLRFRIHHVGSTWVHFHARNVPVCRHKMRLDTFLSLYEPVTEHVNEETR